MFAQGAQLGDSWALLHLGEMYATGDLETGQKKDYATALRLYSESARAGNPIAPFRIGKLFETGAFGEPDLSKIFSYYQTSARRGFGLAQAQVGKAYDRGIGTEANPVEAYVWYSMAAAHGNKEAAALRDPLEDKLGFEQLKEASALLRSRRETTRRVLGR